MADKNYNNQFCMHTATCGELRAGDIPANCFKEVGGTIFVIEKKMRAFFES